MAYNRERYLKRKQEYREYYKKYNLGRAVDRRSYRLQTKYGITLEQAIEMLKAQGNQCKICSKPIEFGQSVNKPAIDHDHSCCPGKVTCGNCIRGILCSSCNNMLGCANDSISVLEKAINYLHNS